MSDVPPAFVRHYRFRIPLRPAAVLRYYLDFLLVPHSRAELARAALARVIKALPRLAALALGARQAERPDPDHSALLTTAASHAGLATTGLSAISLGDYRDSGRGKEIAFLFAPEQARPSVIAKTTPVPQQQSRLQHERDSLLGLRASLDDDLCATLPVPLAVFDSPQGLTCCESHLPGRAIYVEMRGSWRPERLVERHFGLAHGWLAQFQKATIADPAATGLGEAMRKLLEQGGLPEAGQALLTERIALVASLAEQALPSVAIHGDFWARNILIEDSRIAVFDWELFQRQGLPLTDPIHFAISYGLSYPWRLGRWVDRAEAFRRSFDPAGPLRPVIERHLRGHCRAMGLDPRWIDPAITSYLAERVLEEAAAGEQPRRGDWRRIFASYAEMGQCACFGC